MPTPPQQRDAAGKVAHTPTPYEVQEYGYNRRIVGGIYNDGEHRVSTEVCYVAGNRTSQNITTANAEFVARACNSHADLLAAAVRAADYLSMPYQLYLQKYEKASPTDDARIAEMLHAAIAKATEGTNP